MSNTEKIILTSLLIIGLTAFSLSTSTLSVSAFELTNVLNVPYELVYLGLIFSSIASVVGGIFGND